MSFVTAYRTIKPCVAAVIQTFYPAGRPDFPTILGTGFLASRLGLLCTCRHVADAVRSLPRPAGFRGEPASALFFTDFALEGQRGVGILSVPIRQIGDATLIGDASDYLGPNPPDVSFCLLPVTDTPTVILATDRLQEGEEIAFSGFPMGTETLQAPGWLHQLSPTLHRGAVSAVLPHESVDIPHGFLVHANTEGGASGSPVFRDDGSVVGMVYMVLRDRYEVGGDPAAVGRLSYSVPTSHTGCIPFGVISSVLTQAEGAVPVGSRETFEHYLTTRQPIPLSERQRGYQVWTDQAQVGDT